MFSKLPQILATLSVCLIKASFGVLLGFTTISLPHLGLNTTQQSWFASLDFFCLTVFAPIGGMISGWIGRKKMIILCSPVAAFGWFLIAMSSSGSTSTLFAGRFISCLAIALMMSPPTVYVSEIAHPDFRATLSSLIGLSLTSGTSIAWIFGYFCSWRTIAALSTIPLLLSTLTILFFPESPYWLIEAGKIEDAVKSLQFFRGSQYDIAEEISEIQMKHLTKNAHVQNRCTWMCQRLCSAAFWKPFACIGVIWSLNFLSGHSAFSNYLYDLIEESGSTIHFTVGLLIVGIARIPLVFVVPIIAQRLKPKTSFVIGQSIKALGTFAMATYFYLHHLNPEFYQIFSWIPLAVFIIEYLTRGLLIMHVFCTLIGELYPTEIRTLAVGLTDSFRFLVGALATKFYPEMKSAMSLYGLIYLYAGINVINIFWGYFTITDNRSKSLVDIEESFESNKEEKEDDIKMRLLSMKE